MNNPTGRRFHPRFNAMSKPRPMSGLLSRIFKKNDGPMKAPRERSLSERTAHRLAEDGFDLNLSYITPRLIAMSFPGSKNEICNDIDEVVKFLDSRHPESYFVYNLCAEQPMHPPALFHRRIALFPFRHRRSPSLRLIFHFCEHVSRWLHQHPDNVAAVHSLSGVHRPALLLACFLIYSGEHAYVDDALSAFKSKRCQETEDNFYVPSQRHCLQFFYQAHKSGGLPPFSPKKLMRVRVYTLRSSHGVSIRAYSGYDCIYDGDTANCSVQSSEDDQQPQVKAPEEGASRLARLSTAGDETWVDFVLGDGITFDEELCVEVLGIMAAVQALYFRVVLHSAYCRNGQSFWRDQLDNACDATEFTHFGQDLRVVFFFEDAQFEREAIHTLAESDEEED